MFLKINKAFTLVELLVVMGVLAILAAGLIAVLNPADRVNQANDTKILSDINQVIGAVNSYVANSATSSYPAATSWDALGTALLDELTIMPVRVSGTNRSYVVNCPIEGTSCKVSVTLLSKKSLALSGGAAAYACWDNTTGTITYQTTQQATDTCP